MKKEIWNWTAYLGDCLDVMKEMESKIVDLIVTSPPYDNLRTYNWSLEWWEHIWKPIIKECSRIIKKWWVIVWVVWDATIKWSETWTSFRQALYFKDECWLNIHDTMIYAKQNPIPQNHNRYVQCWEYMYVFSKWKPKTVNKILQECKHKWWNSMWTRYNPDWTMRYAHKKWQPIKDTKPKTNIWYYSVWWKWLWHPAIFPEKLAEDHILSWSNEWDIVLDPFMWSNTTWKMAELNNRKWIGIEKDEQYFNIWCERILNINK